MRYMKWGRGLGNYLFNFSSPLLGLTKGGHIINWQKRLWDALKKNYGIIWEFFPNGGTPPPLLGTPYSKKKLSFILHFRPLGTFLVFTNKLKFFHFFYIYFWEKGAPPPPLPKFPKLRFFPPEMNEIK